MLEVNTAIMEKTYRKLVQQSDNLKELKEGMDEVLGDIKDLARLSSKSSPVEPGWTVRDKDWHLELPRLDRESNVLFCHHYRRDGKYHTGYLAGKFDPEKDIFVIICYPRDNMYLPTNRIIAWRYLPTLEELSPEIFAKWNED